MSSDIQICQIPGNSDIAGIGVRASVYAQACLAAFNFLYISHKLFKIAYEDSLPQAQDIEMHSEGFIAPQNHTSLDSDQQPTTNTIQMPAPEPSMPLPSNTGFPPHPDEPGTLENHVPPHMSAEPDQNVSEDQASSRHIPFPTPAPASRASLIRERDKLDAVSVLLRQEREYLRLAKALERSLFMIGFAVILSAIIEAKSATGLNTYHALIVLNISQINNWAGFLILSFRGEMRNWGKKPKFGLTWVTKESLYSPGFVLFTTHAMLMSGLGLYFWSSQGYFLHYVAESPEPCRPLTYFWLFGAIDASNKTLRIASLIFYGISIIPIAGIVLVFVMAGLTLLGIGFPVLFVLLLLLFTFLIIFLLLLPLTVLLTMIWKYLSKLSYLRKVTSVVETLFSSISKPFQAVLAWLRSLTSGGIKSKGSAWFPIFSFCVGIFWGAPIIYFMVSTELIIRVNKVNVEPEAENKWTYGQTLALFTALAAIGLYIYELYFLVRKRRRRMRGLVNEGEFEEFPKEPR